MSQAHALLMDRGRPWLQALRPASDLSPADLNRAFTELESRLLGSGISDYTQYSISEVFRRLCFRNLGAVGAPARLTRSAVKFRSRHKPATNPRRLISDAVLEDQPPVGATPFETYPELRAKVLARTTLDIDRIRAAAKTELEGGRRARELLERLAADVTSVELVENVHHATMGAHYRPEHYEHGFLEDTALYVGALVLVHDAGEWSHKDHAPHWGVLHGREVDKYVLQRAAWNCPVNRVVSLRAYAAAAEIFAAVILIQCATGWNISSVLALRREDVRETADGYELQSFKSKTDDDTPPVMLVGASDELGAEVQSFELSNEDAEVISAVRLLLWNYEQLGKAGYRDKHDTRLIRVGRSKTDKSSLTVHYHLGDFIRRYDLPPFSCEQIRTQVLFIESLGSKDASAPKRIAGHANLTPLGRYLRQQIAKRLSSSANLSMQRALEEEVRSLMERGVTKDELKLLKPIGDGTSCTNPMRPPWVPEGTAVGEMCPGERCHLDGGCSNRRLRVSVEDVREALLTRRVYEENWQDMLSRNQYAFLKFHVPAILFNSALARMLEQGPYSHFASKLRVDSES
ncbi:hypothetical protein QTI04_33860 [Variovorax sp. J22R115]|nr:hypothetical protein [Variovorax sp. J22R115]